MQTPEVSIIIPCYNQDAFLHETLYSVQMQRFQNWEAIIIDDGSIDNSKKIAESFLNSDNRFSYYYQENKGLSSARNFGLIVSKGNYIQFLDSDDLLDVNKLEYQIQLIKKHSNINIVYCDYNCIDENNNKIQRIFHNTKFDEDALKNMILNWGFDFIVPIHSFIFNKDFLDKNQIKFNETIKAREDWFFHIEVASKKPQYLYQVKELVSYRQHKASMVRKKEHMFYNTIQATFLIYRLIPDKYKDQFTFKYSQFFKELYSKEIKKIEKIEKSILFKIQKKLVELKNELQNLW